MYSAQVEEMAEAILPVPAGYKILVAMPKVEEKTEGGIYRPDQLIALEQTASIFGCVVSLGPDAYADTAKYLNGPWCKPGDWVVFRSYSGTRFRIDCTPNPVARWEEGRLSPRTAKMAGSVRLLQAMTSTVPAMTQGQPGATR